MKTIGYSLLRSRKFWAAIVGVVYSMIYLVWPDFPIPEESVIGVVGTVVSYILGVALEDGLSRRNGVDFRALAERVKENEENGNDPKPDAEH